MNILLLVTHAPSSQKAWYAYKTAEALSKASHKVDIFFYSDAVITANRNSWVSADQLNLHKAWAQLPVNRWVCSAAGLQYGVVDSDNQQQFKLADAALDKAYQMAGLGDMAILTAQANRVIQF